jgi:signal transduction histidine kinase
MTPAARRATFHVANDVGACGGADASMSDRERSSSAPAPASPASRAIVGLPDAVQGVGELAGELVHALRNPVSALTTSVDLLSGGLTDADDVPQLHRVMRNELGKLNDLLERCRELTRLSSLSFARYDLRAIVRTRLEARASEFAAREVRLSLELPPRAARIDADESHLGGVFDALVGNALDAMPSGGDLVVIVGVAGPHGTLEVRDTGEGIASNVLPNVFRLFYTTRKGGTGMGLSVARQVLLAHGGTIAIESERGRGTRVLVTLPIAT